MCGIVGLWRTQSPCDRGVLDAMRDLLTHRGPDDCGSYLDGAIGLGHRRLSIIDLASGHQPMHTADGRYVIVFNGEIYNYLELRSDLEGCGITFTSNSDTEVILNLHVVYGEKSVGKLNGIFAYAIWDSRERRLLLARDRAGIKPLYYCSTANGFAFASEIKALFTSGLVAPRLAPERVGEYLLFRHVAGAGGLFRDISSLQAGHYAVVQKAGITSQVEYWSPWRSPAPFKGNYEEAVDTADNTINAAVARQLMSDVPVGTFCSGGIDSSLVTAIASRHASSKINTFSVGFEESDFDESAYARLAAESCGTTHHELRVTEGAFAASLPELIWHHDLPLNFANSVHIHAVSRLARQHVTVVLTGEGADELFYGYPRYFVARLHGPFSHLPRPIREAAAAALSLVPDHRLRRLAQAARLTPEDVLMLNCTATAPSQVTALLSDRYAIDLQSRRALTARAATIGLDSVSMLGLLDFQTYLSSILDRQDKMSMATSVEGRVPFLDNEVIDFAHSLPLTFKQTFRQRKRVLKDVALRYLPASIVHRRKSGFGVPLQRWFAGAGPMSALLNEAAAAPEVKDVLSIQTLHGLINRHRVGTADHSELLWAVVNLHLWRKAFSA